MKLHVYRYTCLTNLHVGSGDVNYSVIDNEVERDLDGNPIIHASGVKGALRQHFTKGAADEKELKMLNRIFGTPSSDKEISGGLYKFLDAHMVSRPMRVSGDANLASIPVINIPALNEYLTLLSAFGLNKECEQIVVSNEEFGDAEFLYCGPAGISVEGEKTKSLSDEELRRQLGKLKNLIGETFAIARKPDDYSLPVMARNYLVNGESKNLWYEEVVPRGSVFYQMILTPDDEEIELKLEKEPIQFGGNASIGCGFIKIEKIS